MKKEISQEVAYELLEVLKEMKDYLLLLGYDGQEWIQPSFADNFHKAEQAIAKVEGKE
jgi:hypothetical protein